jgi:hypothetical protein
MLARLGESPGPNHPDRMITTVVLPDINPVWALILEISKLPDAVHTTKEQFGYHTHQRAQSRDFHGRSSDFNPKAINGPFVTALKRASWADKNVSQEPESLKDQIGLYHLAPRHAPAQLNMKRELQPNSSPTPKSMLESPRLDSMLKPTT